ncbi:MAG: RNA polymerase sigma factor [Candidatus Zixiibacteriota bacterium]
MAIESIESIYKEVCDGRPGAEDRLFKALSVRFSLIARKRIWDRQDAEEIVQDALAAVFAGYKTADIRGTFITWAHMVLRHKVLNYYRSKARHDKRFAQTDQLDLVSGHFTPDPTLENELTKCMQKIVAANSMYGRILILVFQGYSAEEICERLAITKANCYTALSRARSLIKYCLKKGDIK